MAYQSGLVERLQKGETVQFRPHGNSMTPIIKSGQLVTLAPVDPATLQVGDVVLCKVRGHQYLHKVSALKGQQIQISNNKGHVNGWTTPKNIFGKLVKVEP